MLKDTVAFAKHIEDMMRDTLGVSKEESVEEEDELPEEVEEGKIFFHLFKLVHMYLSKIDGKTGPIFFRSYPLKRRKRG